MPALKRTALAFAASCLLLAAATTVPVSAKETWTKVQSKNFTLVGNASEKEIRQVSTRLEQFRDVFSRLFTGARVNTNVPTTVVVFKSLDSYKPFRSGNAIGYFQPGEDVNYITLTTERFNDSQSVYRIIFHEFTHLLVDNNMTTEAPAWFNEGLAEYYSTFEVKDGDKQVVLGWPVSNHVLYLREQKMIPLQTLFSVDHSSPYYNESDKKGVFYAQSWALVHYFLMGKNETRRQQFGRYVELLGKGVSAAESFRQVFSSETETLEKELKKYIGQSSYQAQTATFEKRLEFDNEMRSTPVSDAEAQAYLGDLLLHTPGFSRAEPYLQKAIELDPNSAMALASLGMLRVRQGRFGEAKQYLERAVSANTQNYLAHFYYASALMQGQADSSGMIQGFSPQTAQLIRTHLKKATELAPEFPESYEKLAFLNMITNEQLDESVKLVKRAIALAPGREHYALTLAQVHLRRNDLKSARQLLDALVQNPTTDAGLRGAAQSILGSVAQMEQMEERRRAWEKESEAGRANGGSLRNRDGATTTGNEQDAGTEVVLQHPTASTLRQKRAGEEQQRGLLTRVECLPKGVIVFHVKVGEGLLRLRNVNFQGLEIMTYTPEVSGEFTCGERRPVNPVLVTYRPAKDARAKTDGELVAVDFIPKDWK